jgi:hypothetical protein
LGNDSYNVELVTDMDYVPSLDDLLSDKTTTSVEFRCALDYLPINRAEDDLKAFEDEISKRTTNSMLLWLRCGSSNHFFSNLNANKSRFALDVFAYQKVGTQTRLFSGPVQCSAQNQQLCKGCAELEFFANEGFLMSVHFSTTTGKHLKEHAKVGDRWEFNAVVKKKEPVKSPYAVGHNGNDSAKEVEKARKSRGQKRPKIEPNGLVLIADEVIVSPRRYLSQHDVMSKLMTKAADIAGFCREDDIRELFLHGLEAKQNLRWLYMHIGQIAKMSGPRQVSALNASVRRVMYALNNNTIGALLFRLFLAPIVAEVTGPQMMVESIGANWLKKANLLKNSLELAEHVKHVDLFQNQSTSDYWDLSTIYEPFVEVWPDSQPYFDLFTCCLNMCVDLFAHELH